MKIEALRRIAELSEATLLEQREFQWRLQAERDRLVSQGPQFANTPILPLMAATGNIQLLEDLIKRGATIDQTEEQGRTALHVAAARGDEATVRWAIGKGANVEAQDTEGNTALGLVGRDRGSPAVALILLDAGASITTGVSRGTLNLLEAVAMGDKDLFRQLLKEGVDGQGADLLGYSALHEAACFGRPDIAKELLTHEKKPEVDAAILLGGDTVLHCVIERGRHHRKFMKGIPGREDSCELADGHVEMVTLLLESGATPDLARSDSLTPQALVEKELGVPELSAEARGNLQRILEILHHPPSVKRSAERVDRPKGLPPQVPHIGQVMASDKFEIRLQYHTSAEFRPGKQQVAKFLYRRADAVIEEEEATGLEEDEAVRLEKWAMKQTGKQAVSSSERSYWRWIHLPANNVRDPCVQYLSRSGPGMLTSS